MSAQAAAKVLCQHPHGGRILVVAMHTRDCPYWRTGKRHGPCRCGAAELWRLFRPAESDDGRAGGSGDE